MNPAVPDECQQPIGRIEKYFAECRSHCCSKKGTEQPERKHDCCSLNQHSFIEHLQVSRRIVDRPLFELEKVRKISQPESDASANHRSSLAPSACCSSQCSSSCQQKCSNQLGTQGVKAYTNDRREQASHDTSIEEESRAQQGDAQCQVELDSRNGWP